ncbi:hypothetical protein SKAU_G00242090 [Synaphobranchus kaupii]|uniref:Uncharacterized protein n=1 Tax=Synaphobranchus kaupii TaxID=118154 RepID=A0A9Q1ISB7_SYNKA|nr:hypothetical protein SKAU_G00242090 [Synaphobranchus kaupii]
MTWVSPHHWPRLGDQSDSCHSNVTEGDNPSLASAGHSESARGASGEARRDKALPLKACVSIKTAIGTNPLITRPRIAPAFTVSSTGAAYAAKRFALTAISISDRRPFTVKACRVIFERLGGTAEEVRNRGPDRSPETAGKRTASPTRGPGVAHLLTRRHLSDSCETTAAAALTRQSLDDRRADTAPWPPAGPMAGAHWRAGKRRPERRWKVVGVGWGIGGGAKAPQ